MSPYLIFKIISLVVILVILILILVQRISNKQEINAMNDVNVDAKKKWEESKQTFIEWNSHAIAEEKQKMLKTALFYNGRYDKDIQDYDVQDRMIILGSALDKAQLLELYPDKDDLMCYISGLHFYWKQKEMGEYFRTTFNLNDLYDYETFLSVMVVPGTASYWGIEPHVSET